MSKIVTFEQAVRLCQLGFNQPSWRTFIISSKNLIPKGIEGKMNKNSELCKGYYSAPTISEALDWIRDEKGIECGVHPYAIYEDMPDGDQHFVKWGYRYVAFQGLSEWQNMNKDVFDTYSLAESALLDAVLTYLEEKK